MLLKTNPDSATCIPICFYNMNELSFIHTTLHYVYYAYYIRYNMYHNDINFNLIYEPHE